MTFTSVLSTLGLSVPSVSVATVPGFPNKVTLFPVVYSVTNASSTFRNELNIVVDVMSLPSSLKNCSGSLLVLPGYVEISSASLVVASLE